MNEKEFNKKVLYQRGAARSQRRIKDVLKAELKDARAEIERLQAAYDELDDRAVKVALSGIADIKKADAKIERLKAELEQSNEAVQMEIDVNMLERAAAFEEAAKMAKAKREERRFDVDGDYAWGWREALQEFGDDLLAKAKEVRGE